MKEILNKIINVAHAQEYIPCEDGTMADAIVGCSKSPKAIVNAQSEILNLILKTANSITTIAIALSVIAIIYGGINYIISKGNEERIQKAKKILFWSLFGLIVTLLAKYIIMSVLLIITQ